MLAGCGFRLLFFFLIQDVYEESRLAKEQANVLKNIQRKQQELEQQQQALAEAKV